MRDGQEIRFEREGDQDPDMTPGDVVFELRASSHPVFERKGDHLYVSDTLLLREALLGFNHSLTHWDGAKIAVTRSEDVTQPGVFQLLLLLFWHFRHI